MGQDANCLERSCVWSRMCAEVVRRDRDTSFSYLVRELLPLQAADMYCELAVMRTWAVSVVNRKQYEKNRELVKLEIVGSWSVDGSRTALCLRSLHQLLSAH
ncbi:hypothetical protein F2Q70_00021954 [Brassica cretica]|uniref:Uncharacterized protein n=1 Tax=Brassica cretica TaxID=69181 RepID=A0A8S9GPB1_BRACR|nr:hypothetical protein F2Q70_00021954 [Brassica cretica]